MSLRRPHWLSPTERCCLRLQRKMPTTTHCQRRGPEAFPGGRASAWGVKGVPGHTQGDLEEKEVVKTDMFGWFWLIWARRMDVSTLDGLSVVFVSGLKYSSEAYPGAASSPRLDDRTELSRWIKSSVVLLGSLLCSSQKK